MKKKKWIFILFIIFILVVCISIKSRFGSKSDIDTMEKLISNQIRTDETVIIDTMDVMNEHRLVCYILENDQFYQKVGYADFKINKKGSYELIKVVDADKVSKLTQDIALYQFTQFKVEDYLISTNIVISNNPQLAKVEQIIENRVVQTKEISNNPSISIFEDLDRTLKAKYKCYDKSGGVIQ